MFPAFGQENVGRWRDIGSLHATAMPSTSIFQIGFARPPTISVLAGRRSPNTALRASRAEETSAWFGRMMVILLLVLPDHGGQFVDMALLKAEDDEDMARDRLPQGPRDVVVGGLADGPVEVEIGLEHPRHVLRGRRPPHVGQRALENGGAARVDPPRGQGVPKQHGTLWCEQPLQVQIFFAMDRLRLLAIDDPSLRDQEPYKSFLERDTAKIKALGKEGALTFAMKTHAGTTADDFHEIAIG